MDKKIEYIIEVANCHGGDFDYLISLIDEFSHLKDFNIKFQPLHPDKIATSDFEWYGVYKDLLFSNKEWKEIILKSSKTKKVWLDLFDTYGVEILKENSKLIEGLKLQASILYNQEVLDGLAKLDCSNYLLIINISAIELEDIEERLDYVSQYVNPKEVLLEIGFQSYPTEFLDSGLNKIKILKDKFSNRIVFADHLDGKLPEALTLPLVASLFGVDMIEKHVLHSSLETKYDYFSAIAYDKFDLLVNNVQSYNDAASNKNFINNKERDYLNKSIQIPISNRIIKKGEGINLSKDITFKRSNEQGINTLEMKNLLSSHHILQSDVKERKGFRKGDFKKATIATIIAGRLKSTRLKSKALLHIGEITSVEKCIQSCLNFKDTSYTILATSTTEQDEELKDYCYSDSVIFHQGDPEDVIKRYLDATDKYNIDVVIRVTADMPYVSKEITEILLKSHFENGADYTAAIQCSVGTTPEIINVQALKKVKEYFPNANYSEYMTWYFQNNSEHFKINKVDLPDELIRDYRLTLDYQEDLDMFNKIQTHLDENNKDENIADIYEFLDCNPDVAKINGHITLTYKTDQDLIDTLNKVTKIK
jgi:spore coat polysaccharide biosynthesis protein SpsF (cytidylyltransferase family)/sialic acid synthase SpsE